MMILLRRMPASDLAVSVSDFPHSARGCPAPVCAHAEAASASEPGTTSPSRSPETEVAVAEEEEEKVDEPWRVILYNDEIHTFEEVISQLIKATGCGTGRAEELAWRVHTHGKASVYEGAFEECFRVQSVLREIQLVTEIEG